MTKLALVAAIIGGSGAFATARSLYLAAPSLPLAVPLTSAACLTFALAAAALLPVDVLSGDEQRSGLFVGFWRALYWAALLVGWLGTETLCELLVAGEFSHAGRLRAAVGVNRDRMWRALAVMRCGRRRRAREAAAVMVAGGRRRACEAVQSTMALASTVT